MAEALEEVCNELGFSDPASRFDLFAGSSAGGCAAFMTNQTSST